MSRSELYRELYEFERDCNLKMLAMIESVPVPMRSDTRFKQAVNLAAHLAACRENWLDRIVGDGHNQAEWFEESADLAALAARFSQLEARWSEYLAGVTDESLAEDFSFPARGGRRMGFRTEIQVVQLIGHAHYHRGQVALLVDQLGGKTVDTDYLYWAVPPPG